MCGILAAVNMNATEEILSRSLHTLNHRGPDANGKWKSASSGVWLGHSRLSIVDLSPAGTQPMHNEDGTIWSVCNGEIYNYLDLRKRLEGKGHRFYSDCDSEVVLHAYEAWGDRLVEYLEGMFAFVLWDESEKRLLAARDRVGIKPLYYYEEGHGIALASEVRALLSLMGTSPEPEGVAIAYVMTLGYVPSPWSIWRGVRKLEPGHLLTWESKSALRCQRYWEPPKHAKQDGERDGAWQDVFESVLKEHLLSDVPIGLFLSGGLDSSAIAAGLREIGRPMKTITASFTDSEYDEAPLAEDVSKHLGFPHRAISIHKKNVEGLIERVADIFDEPQGYSALVSMLFICQIAAKEFKVVLAGDGGDELFGGYDWYKYLDGGLSRRSPWIRRVLRPIVRRNATPGLRCKAAQHFSKTSVLHRHAWRLYPRFLPEEAEALLAPLELRFDDEAMLAPMKKHYEPSLPLRRALQRVDLMTFCTDSILAKVDRASMAHSLEVRVPFLDRRIIEWAFSRPFDEESESKMVLRDYLRFRVPKFVLEHPKQGFSLRVLNEFNWEDAIEYVRKGVWVKHGLWATDWERLLHPGVPYRTARIWNLFMLTCWGNKWLLNEREMYA